MIADQNLPVFLWSLAKMIRIRPIQLDSILNHSLSLFQQSNCFFLFLVVKLIYQSSMINTILCPLCNCCSLLVASAHAPTKKLKADFESLTKNDAACCNENNNNNANKFTMTIGQFVSWPNLGSNLIELSWKCSRNKLDSSEPVCQFALASNHFVCLSVKINWVAIHFYCANKQSFLP